MITKPIADAIKEGMKVGSFTNVKTLRNYYNPKRLMIEPFTTPLNRLDNMIQTMKKREISLPPILVRIKPSENGDFYEIVDGRHRLAASVILGYRQVPITIENM